MFEQKKHFPGQREEEVVKMVLRKHWIIHVYAGLRFLMIGILPSIGVLYLLFNFLNTKSPFFFLTLAFLMLFLVFALLYTLITWLNDDLDIIVVTNERVVDITQITLLNRDTSEAHLEQIQDVKGQIEGFFGTILGFGTVSVRTANDISIFELDHVHEPIKNSSKITTLLDNRRNSKNKKLLKDVLQENVKENQTEKQKETKISEEKPAEDFDPKKFLGESRKKTLDTLRGFFKK